jgi:NAD(P)-dependent dehydrogenase (short-subunit alcohol dehydrogenase family)
MTNAAATTASTHMNLKSAAPTVLILGAHGRLGLAAARAFDAAGWKVLAQVRRERDPRLPTSALLLRTPVTDTTLEERNALAKAPLSSPRYGLAPKPLVFAFIRATKRCISSATRGTLFSIT